MRLNAFHDAGSIIIEVADDGKALDRDRIEAKALSAGLIQPGAQLADEEVFRLIFEPGFSTAEAVTKFSGRGVGMDVVKRNIEVYCANTPDADLTAAATAHAVLFDPGQGFPRDGAVDLDALRIVMALWSKYGRPARTLGAPTDYYDASFLAEAMIGAPGWTAQL